ncbi:MAG: ROK family protein [Thermoguttaceae bacterium]|nr:ROK family protein [Thermoguttaceae bacterium]MDW8037564.1 ROK family protein [Thermoguttaceae bacterium]
MYLAIEIGGTKLQLAVGTGQGPPLVELRRFTVDRSQGAEGIRRQIAEVAPSLIQKYQVRAIGIGFGGPVDSAGGRTLKSHHVEGWTNFPLVAWCQERFGLPTALGNDADMAGLGEARFGAGRGAKICFYSNVGTGIGGSLVIEGRLYTGSGGVACEVGHLRPGLDCLEPEQNLESLAAGWGIEAAARALVKTGAENSALRQLAAGWPQPLEVYQSDLLQRAGGEPDRLTARHVAEAAGSGNLLARSVWERACQAYGWALAQVITLIAPDVLVLGGGVSLAGEEMFLQPVRQYVDRYVFPPLRDTYRIVPAALGEEVVLHGALALATDKAAF